MTSTTQDTTAKSTALGAAGPLLTIDDLSVEFAMGGSTASAIREVRLEVHPGEVVAVVGESGSGKSVTSLSVLGLLASNARANGSIRWRGRDLLGSKESELRSLRGEEIAMIFQEPMTALNPVHTVGAQIIETLRLHRPLSKAEARKRAIELLGMVGIPSPETRVDHYPHQLSGGQRQRAMIAMAISCEPKLLIADEPTTALDVTVQAEILELLRSLRERLDMAILLITHDMGVVADLADRVVVMRNGEVVEEAEVHRLFEAPQHEYTQALLAAVPHLGQTLQTNERDASPDAGTASRDAATEPALVLENIVVEYPGSRGKEPFRAIDDVSLTVAAGEVVGLVGESGSGKSTLGNCAVGLVPAASGRILLHGTDVTALSPAKFRPLRRDIAMVFQDPGSSLDPRRSIGDSIAEPMRVHRTARGAELDRRVGELLDRVRIPAAWRNRYPHELSGGQRQRIGIARALALKPKLLVADEPTSALDVSVQASVLDLIRELQSELRFSCLFITHDLAVVELLADRIAVMRSGRLVELGTTQEILRAPEEEYTRRLIASAPVPDPVEQRMRRERLVLAP
ncbi:ABC transporter ATP-binding protein [Ruicaihuangia caeni]|uniref:ABC transporter ATP-binding protein n=1 Tax=Ruicaihuangia caeni TaxID=3042517 RepID=A0AAW6TBH9_9MICO|nr:ABC transporter ATP-binding protein [Klugiella sp. YN-L-19]MDI2098670.1 ABC transporter ATP-binding protein [Klugiella sp. YN-L-19]